MLTTPALLLHRHRYADSSLIITWLTRDHGKLKTIAKGALRPKSAFAGMLDLFHEVEITYARSQRSEIHTLREASLLQSREALSRDYRKVELAAYFAEVMAKALEPDHPEPELYDLLHRAFAHLGDHPATRRALLHFEKETARHLGFLKPEQSGYHALREHLHPYPPLRASLTERLP